MPPLSLAFHANFRNKPLMSTNLRLALFQPDMPPNTGAMMRLCACLGVGLDIIGPTGFVLDDKKLKRVAMDYPAHLEYAVHVSWEKFLEMKGQKRLILLTTQATTPYFNFSFSPLDILVLGRESAGVPLDVHNVVDARLKVPMQSSVRSLNVGMAAALVLGEALRQTGGFVS